MKPPLITHTFQATGTVWVITIFGEEGLRARAEAARTDAVRYVAWFEATFSRFIETSLLSSFRFTKGVVEVPHECTDIFHLYARAYRMTGGAVTPTIGVTLSDAGYDATKRLTPETTIRAAPPLESVLSVLDDTHIEIHNPSMIDFGAIGKGYLVDALAGLIQSRGFAQFMVNGGGDIRYESTEGEPLTVGLEDPRDTTKVIGTTTLTQGGLCGSAINRRRWGTYNHYIDPRTGISPEHIAALWVKAARTAEADMLSSCLFFSEPSVLQQEFPFEYCIITKDMSAHFSDGFGATFF